jgi:hypothetical protein
MPLAVVPRRSAEHRRLAAEVVPDPYEDGLMDLYSRDIFRSGGLIADTTTLHPAGCITPC